MKIYFKQHALLIIISTFLLGFTLLDLLNPIHNYSFLENRLLTPPPHFSVQHFISGSFRKQYEDYISDQFPFRDLWITLKARSEYALGKDENNGILLGKLNYLFEKCDTLNPDTVSKNIHTITEFANTYSTPIYLIIAPNSYEILDGLVPKGALMLDQSALIDSFYDYIRTNSSVHTLNILPALLRHRDDYIYYRTDHHWTAHGAFFAYYTFVNALEKTPLQLHELEENLNVISGFYGTYFSKAKPFDAVPDTIEYYNPLVQVTIDGIPKSSLYDITKWTLRDKYSAFLWGNNGITVINNPNAEDPHSNILVIKDSYANSLIPYLTHNYGEIHVIDLRYATFNMSEYMKAHKFDQILILYNFTSFIEDRNISRLTY